MARVAAGERELGGIGNGRVREMVSARAEGRVKSGMGRLDVSVGQLKRRGSSSSGAYCWVCMYRRG